MLKFQLLRDRMKWQKKWQDFLWANTDSLGR